jgi:hypothetical protein
MKKTLQQTKQLSAINTLGLFFFAPSKYFCQRVSASKKKSVGIGICMLAYSEQAQALRCDSFYTACMLSTWASEGTTALLPTVPQRVCGCGR